MNKIQFQYNHETKLKNQSPYVHVNMYVKVGILIWLLGKADSAELVPTL